MDGKCVEELVRDNEGCFIRFLGNESKIFGPDDLQVARVSACAFVAYAVLHEGIVSAKELVLGGPKVDARFHEIYCFDCLGQRREVANRL